jgi:hypothetical protein
MKAYSLFVEYLPLHAAERRLLPPVLIETQSEEEASRLATAVAEVVPGHRDSIGQQWQGRARNLGMPSAGLRLTAPGRQGARSDGRSPRLSIQQIAGMFGIHGALPNRDRLDVVMLHDVTLK